MSENVSQMPVKETGFIAWERFLKVRKINTLNLILKNSEDITK